MKGHISTQVETIIYYAMMDDDENANIIDICPFSVVVFLFVLDCLVKLKVSRLCMHINISIICTLSLIITSRCHLYQARHVRFGTCNVSQFKKIT